MSIAESRAVEEYNAFGPWVVTVKHPDDVPPLFAGHPIDFDSAVVVLKFPRPESRRDLLAGMDLYDYLIVVTPDDVTVLQRHPGGGTKTAKFADLAAISSGADLLDGHLVMTFIDGTEYSVPYNGSSSDIVTRLVDTIRGLVGGASVPYRDLVRDPIATPFGLDDLGREDAGFSNAANDLSRRELHLAVLSAETRRIVAPGRGTVRAWMHALNPMTLHGSVLAVTDSELIVLSRVRWIARGHTPAVSMSRMVIMLDRVDGMTAAPHDGYPEVTVVTVHSGKAQLELFLPAGSRAIELLVERFAVSSPLS